VSAPLLSWFFVLYGVQAGLVRSSPWSHADGYPAPCWPFEVEEPAASPAPAPPPPPVAAPTPAPAPAPVPVPTPLPLAFPEEARYDIRFGILGSVGELKVVQGGPAPAADGQTVVAVHGEAEGALLGIGRIEQSLDAEFDPRALRSRSWTSVRAKGQGTVVDVVRRQAGGSFQLERRRTGLAPSRREAAFDLPTSDPLGLLLRLRVSPPAAGETQILQALDGTALWRVEVRTGAARERVPELATAGLRLDGEAIPVHYDGSPDRGRPRRRFKLWLSADARRLPLRLEVPVGIADAVITLVEVRGSGGAQGQRSGRGVGTGARS
jgi:hypothetical protein